MRPVGQRLTIGWTAGEEILFKTKEGEKVLRQDACHASKDSAVLAIEKKNLIQIKRALYEKGSQDEFSKLEIVLRGNHLVKSEWR